MKGIWLAAVMALSLPLAAQTPKKAARQTTTLTGCLDQRDESFFLTDPKDLRLLARLEGDDPEHSSYAKYLGHKVAVTGSLSNSGDVPSLRVRAIKIVSETCAP